MCTEIYYVYSTVRRGVEARLLCSVYCRKQPVSDIWLMLRFEGNTNDLDKSTSRNQIKFYNSRAHIRAFVVSRNVQTATVTCRREERRISIGKGPTKRIGRKMRED